MHIKIYKRIFTIFLCLLITACTNIKLPPVQTKSSSIVILPKLAANQHGVYIAAINISPLSNVNIMPALTTALQRKGYHIVPDQKAAYLSLQINLVQSGELSAEQANALLTSDYGGSINFSDINSGAPMNVYAITADVQISQRTQGTSSNTVYWNRYQTRISVQIPVGNLKFEQVQNYLLNKLAAAIVNWFDK